jgi:hypothetical protein
MRKSPIALLLAAVAICAASSCQKIPEPTPVKNNLALETAGFTDAVPLEYGELVSVTPLPEAPNTVVLWFRKPDQSIAAIRVNVSRGYLFNQVLEIPRS